MLGQLRPWLGYLLLTSPSVLSGMREDFKVSLEFLDHFNGVTVWQSMLSLSNSLQVLPDTAGSLGFGISFVIGVLSGSLHTLSKKGDP